MSDTPDVPQVSSPADFRALVWHEQLPYSKLTVRIQRLTLMEMVAQGALPDDLASEALASLSDDLNDAARKGGARQAQQLASKQVALVNAVCCATLVEPRMSLEGEPGTLVPDDMPYGDRAYLFNVANMTALGSAPARFPGGPSADLAAEQNGAGLRAEAVEPAEG